MHAGRSEVFARSSFLRRCPGAGRPGDGQSSPCFASYCGRSLTLRHPLLPVTMILSLLRQTYRNLSIEFLCLLSCPLLYSFLISVPFSPVTFPASLILFMLWLTVTVLPITHSLPVTQQWSFHNKLTLFTHTQRTPVYIIQLFFQQYTLTGLTILEAAKPLTSELTIISDRGKRTKKHIFQSSKHLSLALQQHSAVISFNTKYPRSSLNSKF